MTSYLPEFEPPLERAAGPLTLAVVIFASFLSSATQLAARTPWEPANDREKAALARCEASIRNGLKAPATYSRAMLRQGLRITDERRKVWELVSHEAAPDVVRKWYAAMDLLNGRTPPKRAGKPIFPDRAGAERFLDEFVNRNPVARGRASALSAITSFHVCFDAQNGYGALVRGLATCNFEEPTDAAAPLTLLRPAHLTQMQVLKDVYCSE